MDSQECLKRPPIDYAEQAKIQKGWKFNRIGDILLIREEQDREKMKLIMADPKKSMVLFGLIIKKIVLIDFSDLSKCDNDFPIGFFTILRSFIFI